LSVEPTQEHYEFGKKWNMFVLAYSHEQLRLFSMVIPCSLENFFKDVIYLFGRERQSEQDGEHKQGERQKKWEK